MIIVSVPGRLVRDPATRRVVDNNGLTIDPNDVYWARLLADGDVAEKAGDPVDGADLVAPVTDDAGTPLDPPTGDIADDTAAPATIAPEEPQA
jgi:hypothetical protein